MGAYIHIKWEKRVRCTESEPHQWMYVPSATGTGRPGSLQCQCTWRREGETEWLRICAPAEVWCVHVGEEGTVHSLKCRFSKDQRFWMVIDSSRWCRFHLRTLPSIATATTTTTTMMYTVMSRTKPETSADTYVHRTLWFSVSYSSV